MSQKPPEQQRRAMVAAVRHGQSMRSVARRFRVSLRTVQVWVARAMGQRLDRVDWSDQPRGRTTRSRSTAARIEDLVLRLRKQLKESSPLGEFGAGGHPPGTAATPGPAVAVDPDHRPNPSAARGPGWPAAGPSPAAAAGVVFAPGRGSEGRTGELRLRRGPGHPRRDRRHGAQRHEPARWAVQQLGRVVLDRQANGQTLMAHWRDQGLPAYAQFDNDTIFQGAHQWPNTFGRVSPVVPPTGGRPGVRPAPGDGVPGGHRELQRPVAGEGWRRFQHDSLRTLRRHSHRYVEAARERSAARRDAAPARKPFPADWELDLQKPCEGAVIFLRRTNNRGVAELLGQSFRSIPPGPIGWSGPKWI